MEETLTKAESIDALQRLLQHATRRGAAIEIPISEDPVAPRLDAINAAQGLQGAAKIQVRTIGKANWYELQAVEHAARLTLDEAKNGRHIGAQAIHASEAGRIFERLELEDKDRLPQSVLREFLERNWESKLNNKGIFLKEHSGTPDDPDYSINKDALLSIIYESPISAKEASLLMSSRAGRSASEAIKRAEQYIRRDPDALFNCSEQQIKAFGPGWDRRLEVSGLPYTVGFNEERQQKQIYIPYGPLYEIAKPALQERATSEAMQTR